MSEAASNAGDWILTRAADSARPQETCRLFSHRGFDLDRPTGLVEGLLGRIPDALLDAELPVTTEAGPASRIRRLTLLWAHAATPGERH